MYLSSNIKLGYICIFSVLIIGIVIVFLSEPIAQDINYHSFLDQRTVFGIPNFWNVISNIPFLLVGAMGLYSISMSRIKIQPEMKLAYTLFFFSISLVAFGSGYYHLWPDNNSLVWDRLPMTIAFMALFSIVTYEFVSAKVGKVLLWPLIIFGVLSVFYWYQTEIQGEGDLRLYALVQFLPIVLIPLILIFFKSNFNLVHNYWLLILAYLAAKILEYFDGVIYDSIAALSGHSLKHVVAAFGIYILLKAYNNRVFQDLE